MLQLPALAVRERCLGLWKRLPPRMPCIGLVLQDYFWQHFPKRNLKKCIRANGVVCGNRLFHLLPQADNVAI